MSETRRAGAEILKVIESAADPAAMADRILAYAKDVAGVTQLFARASDGTIYQLTPPTPASNLIVWTIAKTWAEVYTEIQATSGPKIVLVEFDPALHPTEFRVMTANGGAPTNLWDVQFWALSHSGWNIPQSFRVVTIRVDDTFVLGTDPDSGFAILASQNIDWEFDTTSNPIVNAAPCYFEINGSKLATQGTDPLAITDTFYMELSNNAEMPAFVELTGDASRITVLSGSRIAGTFTTTTGPHTIDVFVDTTVDTTGGFGAGITPTFFGSFQEFISSNGTTWTFDVSDLGTFGNTASAGILTFGNLNVGLVATALFLDPGYNQGTSLAVQVAMRATHAGILQNFNVEHNSTDASGEDVIYEVWVNGVATGITVTVDTSAIGGATDASNFFTVAAGDLIAINFTKTGVLTTGIIRAVATLELFQTP